MRARRFLVFAIVLFSLFYAPMAAQDRADLVVETIVTPKKDTILVQQWNGSWWVGGFGGFNGYANFGDLFVEYRRRFLDFSGGLGSGFHAGIMAEYNTPASDLGFFIKVALLDEKRASLSTDIRDTLQNYSFETNTNVQYLTISPAVRYKLPFLPNLYFWGGIDVELNTGGEGILRVIDDTTARIVNERVVSVNPNQLRVGANFGAGVDILLFEFRQNTRVRFTPYVSFHFASVVSSINNSTWNLANARVGFALKFGKNNSAYDTLRYDPFAPEPTPIQIAELSQRVEQPLAFTIRDSLLSATTELAIVQPGVQIEEVVTPPPTETIAVAADQPSKTYERNLPDFRAMTRSPDRKAYISFSEDRENLDNDDKLYLDDLAEFLKANTNIKVALVGYTDNIEGGTKKIELSTKRAQAVQRYLVSKGIPAARFFPPNGRGNLSPRGDDRTPAGRRLNRRVEIIFQ